MANWLYTLEIKDLLARDDRPEFDYAQHSVSIAPECARRVRALMKRCENADHAKVGDLYGELDEVADSFEAVGENAKVLGEDALVEFNETMAMLYDLGDHWHRVWVK